jgi:two-component system OmpR family response regulator
MPALCRSAIGQVPASARSSAPEAHLAVHWALEEGPVLRLLIAEDDPVLADGLVHVLRAAGYAVDRVGDGFAADRALAAGSFDLLILDLGLPRLPGLEVLKRLRARKSAVPVLILTAMDGIDDRVRGLDLGADDYLTKPFELVELEARVRALARRAGHAGQPLVEHGELTFDTVGRVARIRGVALALSARELGLLELLLMRAGRLVSKEQILDHLCQWGEEVSENAVEVYVSRLRKKLEPGGVKISTLRGLGYCLGARG